VVEQEGVGTVSRTPDVQCHVYSIQKKFQIQMSNGFKKKRIFKKWYHSSSISTQEQKTA
jgi:hypothetical protein